MLVSVLTYRRICSPLGFEHDNDNDTATYDLTNYLPNLHATIHTTASSKYKQLFAYVARFA